MSEAINTLQTAMQKAVATRPNVGGFPHLAETLRQAGVIKNSWVLPACQSIYLTKLGPVAMQGLPLITGFSDIQEFNQDKLITALRTDQAGNSTFEEFLQSSWQAGVVRYDVDFNARTVTYYGCNNEIYTENYPVVDIMKMK